MYRLPKYSRSTSVTWSAYSDIECSRLFLYYWLLIRRTNPLVTWFPPVVYSAAREVAGFTSLLLKEMTLRGYNVGLWGFECWRIWITVSRFLALVFHYSSWCVCVCVWGIFYSYFFKGYLLNVRAAFDGLARLYTATCVGSSNGLVWESFGVEFVSCYCFLTNSVADFHIRKK